MTATADSLRYTRWSKEELNERIIALYEQIERITMDNLSVAKENSELEIQISTIDYVIGMAKYRPLKRIELNTSSVESYAIGSSSTQMEIVIGKMTKEQKDIVSRLKKIEDIVLLKNSRTGETKDSSIRDILSKGSSKTIRKDKPTFGIDLKKKQSTIRNDH